MATSHKIEVQLRDAGGKGASRRLRHAGKVPAIVYGGDLPPVPIQMNHNTVWLLSQNEWFYSAILDLSLDGDVQPVLLRDMQRHPYKQQILHLDFMRVKADEIIRTAVQLHFLNEDSSAGRQDRRCRHLPCHDRSGSGRLPRDLPEFIAVDRPISMWAMLHLSDPVLPEGVEIPQLRLAPTMTRPWSWRARCTRSRSEEVEEDDESTEEKEGED